MKKLLSIALTIVMILTFCVPVVQADETAESQISAMTFHAPTIRKMIDLNLKLGNVDEEFYHILANAYLTNPALLAETIADLSMDEITYLAKAISYDLHRTDRVDLALMPTDCISAQVAAVAELIYEEADNASNASIEVFSTNRMCYVLHLPAADR